ncbi:pimeloyl-ACP methyl ester carboxylesterase [Neorhizobium huautlense]|uniref:Pimeloyl-ACP methyl ester carboxylesterase n=1 Tax=Neorhizobium huautlense TaxID=67774 RepID=A0ABT9Q1N7_9HYPH|nr:alpha/beta hydrolase [Neorhizobium huautlense]MDP9840365.1 pimeloyl-ACP methyl ester carboxylesterase [Neorhizobium huautlense]
MTLPLVLPRSAAMPLTFAGTVGLYTPPAENASPVDLAVLFASPWGLEEMCTRKFWRVLSEKFADRGIASLRFDYPDTGDALDGACDLQGLSAWTQNLLQAATELRHLSGCSKIIVVSQGLGAVVAAEAAPLLPDTEAIAFLAPVTSGRMHLRELALWSRVVDENLGLSEEQRLKEGVSIASLIMPSAVAQDVRKADLLSLKSVPACHCLVVERPDRPADAAFAAQLKTLGANVTRQNFEGYDRLVSNPLAARAAPSVIENLLDWVVSLPSAQILLSGTPALPVPSAPLVGDVFCETPLRFGQYRRLSGMLCEPQGERQGATVVFVSSAYDRHCGWGRATLYLARELARFGISSLRFDTANAGDSPPRPGEPEQVLYGSGQNLDLQEAINFLQSLDTRPVIAAGRCSGAYLAMQCAEIDSRITGVVAVNIATFRWKTGRSVEEAVNNAGRSLGEYGARALRLETVKRLLRGEIHVVSALSHIGKSLAGRIRNRALGVVRFWLPHGRSVQTLFRHLQAENKPVALLYSENDYGLEEFDYYFGQGGGRLAGFDNVSVTMIPAADHNLTPAYARETYLSAVRHMALQIGQAPQSTADRPDILHNS